MAQLPETFEGALEIAIIGGTGLTKLPSFQLVAELPLTHPALITPWGSPSAPITVFSHPRPAPQPPLNVAFLARHGATHQYAPHEVPSRANIAALRKLGVRCVLAFSAVGSLKEEVRPRDFVVPDQVIDRTKGVRPWTFFENGVVVHVGFSDPFDDELRDLIHRSVEGKGVLEGETARMHDKGLLICMEGPQFSTRAESLLHAHAYGASVINMSCLPEAKLAREAELAYAMICMSTDYDAWHPSTEPVSVEMVMSNVGANAGNARNVAVAVLDALDQEQNRGIVTGAKWKGMAKSGLTGMADVQGEAGVKGREALRKLEWLFPGDFGT